MIIRPAWQNSRIEMRIVDWMGRFVVKEIVYIDEQLSHVGFDSDLFEMERGIVRI
jgi:hypothetical protein